MDHSEWIALGIVGVAMFFFIRGLLKPKGPSCCGKKCAVHEARKKVPNPTNSGNNGE